MKVCNLLTLPGMTRGMHLSVMEATSRAEIESEQNILRLSDLLDGNVGNKTYHDKTISKERQYAPIEIYDGDVRNTHVISKNPVLGNSVARPDMSRILSVFPNVKLEWLKLKMKEYRNTDTIISYMAENGYPEEKDSDAAIANRQTDYYVVDNLRITSATYRRDARIKLAMKFRKVPYSTIDIYFRKYSFQYVPRSKLCQ